MLTRSLQLHDAVEHQRLEEVEALLAAGANPNALDDRGKPPLGPPCFS